MPGRLRTASSPRSTLIESAVYSSAPLPFPVIGRSLISQLMSHRLSSSRCERRIGDGKELRTAAQALEECGVGAGQPGLRAQPQDLAEERAAARGVEM